MTSPLRPLLAVLVLLVAGLALAGSSAWSGPVVLTLTAHHGVHATDPLVLAAAAAALVRLGLRPGPAVARVLRSA